MRHKGEDDEVDLLDDLPPAEQAELRGMDAAIQSKKEAGLQQIEDNLSAQRDALTLKQAKRTQAIEERRVATDARVQNIRMEIALKMREGEDSWQKTSKAWLNRATARIAVKRKEDADAKKREQAKQKKRRKRG